MTRLRAARSVLCFVACVGGGGVFCFFFLFCFVFLMIRRPPRSTLDRSSAASDVYKRQVTDVLAVGVALKERARGEVGGGGDGVEEPVGGDHRDAELAVVGLDHCLLYTSPSPRDRTRSRMPSSA